MLKLKKKCEFLEVLCFFFVFFFFSVLLQLSLESLTSKEICFSGRCQRGETGPQRSGDGGCAVTAGSACAVTQGGRGSSAGVSAG